MTTVALIGASGFIGGNLSAELARSNARVAALGRLTLATQEAVVSEIDGIKPDVVVHLASNLVPGSTECEYLDERSDLMAATAFLADRLAERQIMLVYASSGGAVYGPATGDTLSENQECAPINYYGQAKLEVETYLRFAARTLGLRHLVVRPSNPYGPGQDPRSGQGLVTVVIDRAMRGEALEVWGDGSVVRDYIHVQDMCRAIVHLMEAGVEDQVVNIGSGVGHSLLEVVEVVERHLGQRVPLLFKEARPVDSPRAVLDVTRMRGHGVAEPRSLDLGVRAYVEHLRGSR
jgi:UDP-glucose 4-epimerase